MKQITLVYHDIFTCYFPVKKVSLKNNLMAQIFYRRNRYTCASPIRQRHRLTLKKRAEKNWAKPRMIFKWFHNDVGK